MSAGSSTEPAVAPGTLYVVATPIGNLGDLSTRAREVLARVQLIAAEDTRHTRQLLQAFGIDTPLTSLHEHNEMHKSETLIARLLAGEAIALVSDAGTPLISDPGFNLVAAARTRGVSIAVIPGPCAAIAALSIAGLPTDRFVFEGFLPAKTAARVSRLRELIDEQRTMIFYEAPHRLLEVLRDLAAEFGAERSASVSRELTKKFETTYTGTLANLCEIAEQNADMARGEIVIIVTGHTAPKSTAQSLNADQLLRALLEELPPSQAAKIAAKLTGEKRADLYARAMQLGGSKRED
ncbi:16S rRNA (cytidine(1402)-2'-O)-methyltransferase [Steroidobacter sp.]|uniref:16S rRNA (cytidine(1402)-2'-O)-methyltransferase n=1 Tax=Steroidobacter sp. TaxID=1978227 RepID=UPI001A59B4E4|nr:16S rRNA (cytidine(1402)-2'-O)-methyltransferase [Steroidobacter sp.]MBL8266717.1 16S rRNA (cytidine(1402)-2'-O)-methyltransferase [Steroidobacter sp.]